MLEKISDTRGMYENLLTPKFCKVQHNEHYRKVRYYFLRLSYNSKKEMQGCMMTSIFANFKWYV